MVRNHPVAFFFSWGVLTFFPSPPITELWSEEVSHIKMAAMMWRRAILAITLLQVLIARLLGAPIETKGTSSYSGMERKIVAWRAISIPSTNATAVTTTVLQQGLLFSSGPTTTKITLTPSMTGEIIVGGQPIRVLFDTRSRSNLIYTSDKKKVAPAGDIPPLRYYSRKSSRTIKTFTGISTGSGSVPALREGELALETVRLGTWELEDMVIVVLKKGSAPQHHHVTYTGTIGLGYDSSSSSSNESPSSTYSLVGSKLPNLMFSMYISSDTGASEITFGGVNHNFILKGSRLEVLNVYPDTNCDGGDGVGSWCINVRALKVFPPGGAVAKKKKNGYIQIKKGEELTTSGGGVTTRAVLANTSPYIVLPREAYGKLIASTLFKPSVGMSGGDGGGDGSTHQTNIKCSGRSSLPDLEFVLGKSVGTYVLGGKDYTANPASRKDKSCQLLVTPHDEPYIILGQPFMRKYYTVGKNIFPSFPRDFPSLMAFPTLSETFQACWLFPSSAVGKCQ